MANTTFSGPLRSEGGFKSITKDSDTGAITENITYGNKGEVATPVVLADGEGNVYILFPVTSGIIFTLPPLVAAVKLVFASANITGVATKPLLP